MVREGSCTPGGEHGVGFWHTENPQPSLVTVFSHQLLSGASEYPTQPASQSQGNNQKPLLSLVLQTMGTTISGRKCGWYAAVSDRQVAAMSTRLRKPEKNIPD